MPRVFGLALAVLTLAPGAAAKDGLLLDRATARAGERVVVSTPWASHPDGVVVYFIPLAASPRWWPTRAAVAPNYGRPPALRAAIRVGRTARWGDHGARLVFRVPASAPGRYVLGFWCVPCGTYWTSALPNYQPPPTTGRILRVLR